MGSHAVEGGDVVVYLPSCAVRTMGNTRDDRREPLPEVTVRLLERAGFTVRIPKNVNDLCCGKAFETKGFYDQARSKIRELEKALREASDNGLRPILCDTSPCLARMKKEISGLALYEPIEFAHPFCCLACISNLSSGASPCTRPAPPASWA
jgi:D-lactate dehydrogenase